MMLIPAFGYHTTDNNNNQFTISVNEDITLIGTTLLINVAGANGTTNFEITSQDGTATVIQTFSYTPFNNKDIRLSWLIPQHTTPGIYTITATDNFNSDSTTFEYYAPITVATGNSFYSSGDIINIKGSITTLSNHSQPVTIILVNPNGNVIDTAQLAPRGDGSYWVHFHAEDTMNVNGTYTVIAQYGSLTAETTFNFEIIK